MQGGISTRESYPRQRISFLPLSMIYRGRSPPHSRTLASFPKHRPRPSGPPSRCRLVRQFSSGLSNPRPVDAKQEDFRVPRLNYLHKLKQQKDLHLHIRLSRGPHHRRTRTAFRACANRTAPRGACISRLPCCQMVWSRTKDLNL